MSQLQINILWEIDTTGETYPFYLLFSLIMSIDNKNIELANQNQVKLTIKNSIVHKWYLFGFKIYVDRSVIVYYRLVLKEYVGEVSINNSWILDIYFSFLCCFSFFFFFFFYNWKV